MIQSFCNHLKWSVNLHTYLWVENFRDHLKLRCDKTVHLISGHLTYTTPNRKRQAHDDVIKWNHFPRNWPFVRGIQRSPVNSPHKGQWCGALMLSLICVWINDWVNNRDADDLRLYCAHYGVILMRDITVTWMCYTFVTHMLEGFLLTAIS